MPIVYVHGVSVRDDREWNDLELLLRRYVAPVISWSAGEIFEGVDDESYTSGLFVAAISLSKIRLG